MELVRAIFAPHVFVIAANMYMSFFSLRGSRANIETIKCVDEMSRKYPTQLPVLTGWEDRHRNESHAHTCNERGEVLETGLED